MATINCRTCGLPIGVLAPQVQESVGKRQHLACYTEQIKAEAYARGRHDLTCETRAAENARQAAQAEAARVKAESASIQAAAAARVKAEKARIEALTAQATAALKAVNQGPALDRFALVAQEMDEPVQVKAEGTATVVEPKPDFTPAYAAPTSGAVPEKLPEIASSRPIELD